MTYVSQAVWLARWLMRLSSALLRKRRIIDLVPPVLSPRRRIFFDRRRNKLQTVSVRKTLSDYWSYDQSLVCTAFDLSRFPQGRLVRERYAEMLAGGRKPIILDLGANIGCSAYWFGIEFPDARVLAVEPDASNASLASINTAICGNVTVIQGAVCAEDCNVELTNTGHGEDAYRTVVAQKGSIKGFSIRSLLHQADALPDDLLVVKVDIEGFEKELFSRNTDWVQHASAIIAETHDWLLPGQATAIPLLRAISNVPRDFLVDGDHVISFRH